MYNFSHENAENANFTSTYESLSVHIHVIRISHATDLNYSFALKQFRFQPIKTVSNE